MRSATCFVLALAAVLAAGEMTVVLDLDDTPIDLENAGPYVRVTAEGMGLETKEGLPSLPVGTVRIAVPTGCVATSIEVADQSWTGMRSICTVMPTGPQVPFSIEQAVTPVEPNPEVYSGAGWYPSAPIELTGSSVVLGIPVAYAELRPVRWDPEAGTLQRLSSATLTVTYEPSPEASTVRRRSAQSELRSREIVRRSVVNPQDVGSSGASIIPSRDLEYGEYVIITYPNYEIIAEELADWKTLKGVPTTVVTTTEIQAEYSCYDLQQEIRAFLTDCIAEGVEYVLIYGDDDRIAGRDTRIHYSSYTEYPPVDLYWADINDTAPGADRWDSNNNHVWGEYYGDDVDYHPDLWVGRASVNTVPEGWIFNDKVFIYEGIQSTDYFETAPREMRIGYTTELLWGSPYNCYGSAGAELISAWTPSGWEEEKCYDSSNNNSVSITVAMIDDGPHHVYHASHGSATGFSLPGGTYRTSHIMSQTNISGGGLPAIFNSISCLIGHLDNYECCGDAWLVSPNGGGFGAFNARYGWGNPSSPGYGVSEVLSRYFYDVMWNDGIYGLGPAHAMSNDMMSPPGNEVQDWCVKEYNLFGDPEMPMWSTEAADLGVSHPASIDGSTGVTVTVTSGGSPVEGARVCLMKGDDWRDAEVYEVGTTNASGEVELYVSPATTGDMSVVAWYWDHVPYQGSINVTETGIEQGGERFVNSVGAPWPSPASGGATVPFSLASSGTASMQVYDLTGRLVTTVEAGSFQAGEQSMSWDLTDGGGAPVPSGVYHIVVRSGNWSGGTRLVVGR